MKHKINIALIMIFIFSCLTISIATQAKPSSISTPQKREDKDKVYSAKEVDVKPKIKKPMEHPQPTRDCPRNGGQATVRAILHKSGKVTRAILVQGMGCGFDERALEAAQKIEFTPAMKDGQPVSMYTDIRYNYTQY
jgi:TonB family protein